MDQSQPPRRFASAGRLGLVLGSLAAVVAMAKCGDSRPPQFDAAEFTTVSSCTAAGFPADLCQASYDAAFLAHRRSAPQFTLRENCENEWGEGQCTSFAAAGDAPAAANGPPGTRSPTSDVFVPALAGFVVSPAMQQRYCEVGKLDSGGFGSDEAYRGTPIYRSRAGDTVIVDRSSGTAVTIPVNVATRTLATHGFGGPGLSCGDGGRGG